MILNDKHARGHETSYLQMLATRASFIVRKCEVRKDSKERAKKKTAFPTASTSLCTRCGKQFDRSITHVNVRKWHYARRTSRKRIFDYERWVFKTTQGYASCRRKKLYGVHSRVNDGYSRRHKARFPAREKRVTPSGTWKPVF